MAPRGTFSQEAMPEGWFDETLRPEGWFSSDFLEPASSGTNATANGTTLTATLSLIAGSATGQQNITASGTTLTETLSIIAGAASGQQNVTASGATLTITESLISGAASGQSNATASGAVVSYAYSLTPGAASSTGSATANGFTAEIIYLFAPGEASATGGAVRSRGDDGGVRERFWRSKAEKWLEDKLETLERAVGKPQRARKRLAAHIIVGVPAFVSDIPEFAPRVNAIEDLAQRFAAPTPDYAALALAIDREMELIANWQKQQRRRRDIDALLVLAA